MQVLAAVKVGEARFPDHSAPALEQVPFYWHGQMIQFSNMKLTSWIPCIWDMMKDQPEHEGTLVFSCVDFTPGLSGSSYHGPVAFIEEV